LPKTKQKWVQNSYRTNCRSRCQE